MKKNRVRKSRDTAPLSLTLLSPAFLNGHTVLGGTVNGIRHSYSTYSYAANWTVRHNLFSICTPISALQCNKQIDFFLWKFIERKQISTTIYDAF